MNDLVSYILRQLQGGGTSVVPSGRGVSPYIHYGEVQPPPRETNGKPATRMGPLIEGEAIRPVTGTSGAAIGAPDRPFNGPRGYLADAVNAKPAAVGGSLSGLANPLMAAIMGSIQGDVRNNHKGFFSRYDTEQGPAVPQGQVTSAPMPGLTPPQVPISQSNYTPPQVPQQPQSPPQPPWWANATGADFGPSSAPMPQPRPQQVQAAMPMPMARPAVAPQAAPQPQPPMGFFQRNAAMMRDPATGAYIDPQAAAQAGGGSFQPSQGSLLGKMLALSGTPGVNRNGSIAASVGPTSVGGAPLQQSMSGPLTKLFGMMNG